MWRLVLVLAIALLLVIASPSWASPILADDEDEEVAVIIQAEESDYDDLEDAIEKRGGSVSHRFDNIDAIAASIPIDKLAEVGSLPGVVKIFKDRIVSLPPRGPDGIDLQTLNMEGLELKPFADVEAIRDLLPDTFVGYLSGLTDAQAAWPATDFGAGATVAVIDTGTWDGHVCLAGRVVAGPDFSPDLGTLFEGSTLVTNNFHGTFVAGVVGSNCALFLPAADALAVAISTHSPDSVFPLPSPPFLPGLVAVPLLGIAPEATIYAVKVFPFTGAGVLSSIIIEAIDHVIAVKLAGTVDVDVINMSLGGATLFDGEDPLDLATDAACSSGLSSTSTTIPCGFICLNYC